MTMPVGLAVVSLVLAFVYLWLIPAVRLHRRRRLLSLAEKTQLEAEHRRTLGGFVGGVVLLAGAYLGWQQLVLGRKAQDAEQLARAVAQLADSAPHVRLSGVIVLARIARDSPKDRQTVRRILAVFLQRRRHVPCRSGTGSQFTPRSVMRVAISDDEREALRVLGMAGWTSAERQEISRINLDNVSIEDVDLSELDFTRASLRCVQLLGVDLRRARMDGTDLIGSVWMFVRAEGATFRGAYMYGAVFYGTGLDSADLRHAKLGGVWMDRVGLNFARMDSAIVSLEYAARVEIGGASVKGTKVDRLERPSRLLLTCPQVQEALFEVGFPFTKYQWECNITFTLPPEGRVWMDTVDGSRWLVRSSYRAGSTTEVRLRRMNVVCGSARRPLVAFDCVSFRAYFDSTGGQIVTRVIEPRPIGSYKDEELHSLRLAAAPPSR